MTNLFNMDIDRIKHNGDDVILIMLNGFVVYENLGISLTYTVHNDTSGSMNPLMSGDIPQFWDFENGATTVHHKNILIIKLDGSIENITENKSIYFSNIAKVKISYSENVDNIRFQNMDFVKTVDYVDVSNLTHFRSMFKGCVYIESINMNGWDTSNIIDMSEMFWDCAYLTTLDVSGFDTSNVTNMSDMFRGCCSLPILDVSNFDTSNVTNMSGIFTGCESLPTLDVSNFDTSYVTNMRSMFEGCQSLPILDVSNFDTSKVIDMGYMFADCESLTTLDLSNFNTSKVTNMIGMFIGCNNLTSLDLSNFDTSNVTDINGMFSGCNSLCELKMNNCDNETITKILNSSFFPTGTIQNTRKIYCKKEYIEQNDPPDGWVFVSVNGEPVSPEEPIGRPLYIVGQFAKDATITTADVLVDSTHNDLSNMFEYCESLTSVNTEGWNTGNVTTMKRMFYYCPKLTQLDVSNFDTSNVADMDYMFSYCESLTELDLSNWDISNVWTMDYMFEHCDSLTSLDCSGWDVSNVIYLTNTFNSCPNLVNFQAPKNIKTSMKITLSSKLSHDSLMSIINNLATVTTTQTLTLGSTNRIKLSSAEIAIATNKGWTVS